ncbi:hypothetical protein CJF42_23805, partial [Pseudoalteromonas sp. NBT06-2]|uniref:SpvB/TcaC N-terminal domain-containing protein n=1 Tax=Pseudoalteromonas sp. NBT06-2 TaxID=2025950 RepID=UPI000BA74D94
ITSLSIEGNYAFFTTDGTKTHQIPQCVTATNTQKWILPLADKSHVYELLALAKKYNQPIEVTTANTCHTDIEVAETANINYQYSDTSKATVAVNANFVARSEFELAQNVVLDDVTFELSKNAGQPRIAKADKQGDVYNYDFGLLSAGNYNLKIKATSGDTVVEEVVNFDAALLAITLVYTDAAGNLYLKIGNTYLKLQKDASNHWSVTTLTNAEWNEITLIPSEFSLEIGDFNSDGLEDFKLTNNDGSVVITAENGSDGYVVNSDNISHDWSQTLTGTVDDTPSFVDTIEPTSSTTVVGAIAGQASVNGGSASYNVPITLPPGRNGVKPNVSLNYSSRSGNGIAGVGWSLSAGSSISRCAATYAQDGFTHNVQYNATKDRLCLNGQRLMVIGTDTYGASNATYRTEIDSFVQVTQTGALNGTATSFTAKYKNGTTAYFGMSDNSRTQHEGATAPLSWNIEYQHDTTGNNFIHYDYSDDTDNFGVGEKLLTDIHYTGNSTTEKGNRKVSFTYADRSDSSSSYLAGGKSEKTQVLANITTYYNTSKVKQYTLNTELSSASQRTLIKSISECDVSVSTSTCLPLTNFNWHDDGATMKLEPLSVDGEMLYKDQFRLADVLPHGDLNGDGVRDWPGIFVNAEGELTGEHDDITPCYYNYSTSTNICVEGDYNQDGRTDSWLNNNQKLVLKYTALDGTVAKTINTNIPLPNSQLSGIVNSHIVNVDDYNGDGWPDIVIYEVNSGGVNLMLYKHTQNHDEPYVSGTSIGSMVAKSESGRGYALTSDYQFMGDMTGNGLPDLIKYDTGVGQYYGFPQTRPIAFLVNQSTPSTGISFINRNIDLGEDESHPKPVFSHFIDINGDGLQDWLGWRQDISNNEMTIKFNLGNGYFSDNHHLDTNVIATQERLANKKNAKERETRSTAKYSGAFKNFDINNDGIPELLMPGERIYEACIKKSTQIPANTKKTFCGDEIYSGSYHATSDHGSITNINSAKNDHSIYRFKAVFFNLQEDGSITLDVKDTNLIGHAYQSSIIDAFGNGLPTMVFNHRGTDTIRGITFKGSASGAFEGNENIPGIYINRNFGTGKGVTNTDYQPTDMIKSTVNGIGLTSEFKYRPLSSDIDTATKTEVYQQDKSSPREGYLYFASSMYVVQEFNQSNGIGTTNQKQYAYENAMFNTQGRGFMGFKSIIEKDVTQGLVTQSDFNQFFPYQSKLHYQGQYTVTDYKTMTGAVKNNQSKAISYIKNIWSINSNHKTLNSTTTKNCYYEAEMEQTYCETVAGSNSIQHLYLASSVNKTRAVDNNNNVGDLVTTATKQITGIDAWGNVITSSNTLVDDWGKSNSVVSNTFDTTDETGWPTKLTDTQKTSNTIMTRNANDAYTLSNLTELDSSNTVYTHIEYDTHSRKPNLVRIASTAELSETACKKDDLTCSSTATVYNTYGLPTSVSKTAAALNASGNPALKTRWSAKNITHSSDGKTAAADGYFPLNVENHLGHIVTTFTSPEHGKTVQINKYLSTNNYVKTIKNYDSFGRDFSTKTDGTPTQYVTYTEPDTDKPSSNAVMQVTTTQVGSPTQKVYLDKLGRQLRTAVESFDGSWVFQDKRFNAQGNLIFESLPKTSGGTEYGVTYTGHDVLGRPASKITPQACGTDMTASYTYNALETEITAVDGCLDTSLSMSRTYNSLKQLVKTVDAKSGVTRYAYNNLGLPIVITDAGNNNVVAIYNFLGQKVQVIDPNQGTTNFVYNGFGELQKETRVDSKTVTYTTDMLGRVTKRSATGEDALTYVYDTAANGFGQLHYEYGNGATRTYSYDTYGRMIDTQMEQGSENYHIETLFDSNYGRPKGLRYPNDLTLSYEYNDYGYQTKIKNAASDYVYRHVTEQDHFGNTTVATLGNGITQTAQYDASSSQVKQLLYSNNSVNVLNLEYTKYDGFGNLTDMKVTSGAYNNQHSFTEKYDYDTLHRLSASWIAGVKTIDYRYDAVGNLISKSDYANQYNYTNHLAGYSGGGANAVKKVYKTHGKSKNSWVGFSYDARGNMAQGDGLVSAIYNAMDKPTSLNKDGTQLSFIYGPNHMRTKQIRTKGSKSVSTYYADKLYEVEIDGSKRTTRAYLGDIAIIKQTYVSNNLQSQDISYTLKDRLGSSRIFTDADGDIIGDLRNFDPFGKPRLSSGQNTFDGNAKLPDVNGKLTNEEENGRRGFTDHEHLDEVELIHMNGRVYDYNLGRFMSVDPLIQAPGNSQSINPYSYIMNNPLAGTDPTGYAAEEVEKKIKVSTTGSRIKRTVTATVSSNGTGGATVTFSGGNGAARNAAKNAVAGKLSGAGFNVADIGSQSTIAKNQTFDSGTKRDAQISSHIYSGEGNLPDGVASASQEQREWLGIESMVLNDEESGFKSDVYYDSNTSEFIYATAGTDGVFNPDMVANGKQAFGGSSRQYQLAIQNARTMRDAVQAKSGKLSFTGHSLGGGLASANALATGLRARTYNAAGLHAKTVRNYGGLKRASKLIDAYHSNTDVLSILQDYTPLPDAAGRRIGISGGGMHGIGDICRSIGTKC